MSEFKSQTAPDNVSRLKQLLFDNENQHLSELSSRLKGLQQAHDRFDERLRSVIERTGDDERLRRSVASILDGAISDANAERHAEISEAVAPLVVGTVKTEIRNSKDELVEALYPMTGQMVKAYVASAMRELAENINRKLDRNPVMLRLRSLASGRSVGELVLASAGRLKVDQIHLLRRGSGELISRWPASAGSIDSDQVMGGVLTAINDFASEALKDDGGSLREIDLGDRCVYLRASPMYLLAAVCSGSAPASVEKILDERFLGAIDDVHRSTPSNDNLQTTAADAILDHLARKLDGEIGEEHERLVGNVPSGNPLKALMWFIGLPLVAVACWSIYDNYRTERTRAVAVQVLQGSSAFVGYPADIDVGWLGRSVSVSGLAPSEHSKTSLANKLKIALPPGTGISVAGLGVVKGAPDRSNEIAGLRQQVEKVSPELNRLSGEVRQIDDQISIAVLQRALQRTRTNLQMIKVELPRLRVEADNSNARAIVARLDETTTGADRQLAGLIKAAGAPAVKKQNLSGAIPKMEKMRTAMIRRAHELSTLLVDPNKPIATSRAGIGSGDDLTRAGDLLETSSDHLVTMTIAVAQLAAIRRTLIPKPQGPTVRQELEDYIQRHAVFFGQGTSYRNGKQTAQVLDGLAKILSKGKDRLRIVGYTDETGGDTRNTPLSERRAKKVRQALVKRGISGNRLLVLGRKDARDISAASGDASPNRRVEFEFAFDNEVSR
jgi:outer membrane protein OmpA-like peptidoglycan-associated protein